MTRLPKDRPTFLAPTIQHQTFPLTSRSTASVQISLNQIIQYTRRFSLKLPGARSDNGCPFISDCYSVVAPRNKSSLIGRRDLGPVVIDGAAVPSQFGGEQYHTVQLMYRGRRQGHEVSDRICALAPYDTAPCQFPWPCFRGMTAPCPLCGSSSEWIIHDGPASGGKTIRRVHLEFDGGSRYEKTDQ